jgi:alanine-synthesizing transaminase
MREIFMYFVTKKNHIQALMYAGYDAEKKRPIAKNLGTIHSTTYALSDVLELNLTPQEGDDAALLALKQQQRQQVAEKIESLKQAAVLDQSNPALLKARSRPRDSHVDLFADVSNPTTALQSSIKSSAMRTIMKSAKLDKVCYDIRGPLLKAANAMEEQGHKIIKLNIGNPAPFGFEAPQEILSDIAFNLPNAVGYSDSKGIFSARKAVLQYYQQKGMTEVVNVNDVYIGNGVSELIVMSMQALLNTGDEMLIPMPDYPLWTASVNLAGGQAVHYKCDEENHWYPDIADMEAKITAHTRGIVIINPNNPTGSVYPRHILVQIVELARKHDLILFADEIYDKIIYDGIEQVSVATLAPDLLCITFNGLSKSHRVAGFRSGWMLISGNKSKAGDYIEGLDMLASMRLCANVQAQYAIQTALGGYQSINDLIRPGGRFYEQRNIAWQMLNEIPGVSCVKPEGALYCFPRLDPKVYPIEDDTQFMLDLLKAEKVLLVQGTGFNWPTPDHFRVVFLPAESELKEAMTRIGRFLASRR